MRFTVKLSNQEYQKIKLRAEVTGLKSLSAFFRDRLLKDNHVIEKKVREIYWSLVRHNDEK